MPTRLQVIVPIAISALIIGVFGILTIPSDSILESVDYSTNTTKLQVTHL